MNEREQLAKDNGMTIEFVNWFFDNKKDGCGNAWFIMMAAMWEGWNGREAKCAALAAELNAVEAIHDDAVFITDDHYEQCPPEVQKIIRSLAVMQITAYKAFLAEVRAQGVEIFGDYLNGLGWDEKDIKQVSDFAAQLRQEAAQ